MPPAATPSATIDPANCAVPVETPVAGSGGGHGSSSLTAHFPAVYRDLVRFIARRTGNDDDARDLAHDTWLRLAEHERSRGHSGPAIARDTAPTNTRAYLFTVAHHLAIDHLRRRRLGEGTACAVAHTEPDVADAVMYRQAVQAVETALQSLPDRARDVFLQHRLLGVAQAELAERYGLSRNMIERDVMLAMDHVQAAIEQWHGGDAPHPNEKRRGRRRSLAALLGLAGLFTTGGAAWQAWQAWQAWRSLVPQWQMALASRRGQLLRQPLPDGSELVLDALSQADVSFFAAHRHVQLRVGAAFFSVAHDVSRPFVVDAGAARITVLGTRFAVELDGSTTEVQVESGRVQVQAVDADGQPGAPLLLQFGQALRVRAASDSGAAAPDQIKRLTQATSAHATWRTGVLVFEATPLRDALQRLDRYGGAPVTVDARVAALPVSGQVRIAQAQDWLLALPAVLPVRVERSAQGTGAAGWHIGPT